MDPHVPIRSTYALTKRLIEQEALRLRERNPWLHLADACAEVLRRRPAYWCVYREAMRIGCVSEFQRPHRRRAIPTPKDRAWDQIEMLARTLVAASREPLTLRNAVASVVTANPALYDRYAKAKRR